jgi:hypothetical protein
MAQEIIQTFPTNRVRRNHFQHRRRPIEPRGGAGRPPAIAQFSHILDKNKNIGIQLFKLLDKCATHFPVRCIPGYLSFLLSIDLKPNRKRILISLLPPKRLLTAKQK